MPIELANKSRCIFCKYCCKNYFHKIIKSCTINLQAKSGLLNLMLWPLEAVMFKMIESDQVATLIVKDMSRLGRNYIEVS